MFLYAFCNFVSIETKWCFMTDTNVLGEIVNKIDKEEKVGLHKNKENLHCSIYCYLLLSCRIECIETVCYGNNIAAGKSITIPVKEEFGHSLIYKNITCKNSLYKNNASRMSLLH